MPTSPAYEKFLASLTMDFDKWHDGEGIDLDAIAAFTDDERKAAVSRLITGTIGWREIEALAALQLPAADQAIDATFENSHSIQTRLAAAKAMHEGGRLKDIGDVIAAMIDELTSIEGGLTTVLLAAEEHPTDAVKNALLRASFKPTEAAMHCAALLCYLRGVATEAFDWNLRPLFLRLARDNAPVDRHHALAELCKLVNMMPPA